jgi:Heparinase II/III-like protein
VLPASFARPPTHDHVLDLGSAVLALPRLIGDGPVHEEVAWSLGIDAWLRLTRSHQASVAPSTGFTSGGLYVLGNREMHAVVRWGDVGQNGVGGHGHSDLSSFELSHGVPFVVDPGTYVYTADAITRNAFRSARAHNVAVVDGLEMHGISPERPFAMLSSARFGVDAWWDSSDVSVLIGWHDGYTRNGSLLVCRRTIMLDKQENVMAVSDEMTGTGSRRIESFIHLAAGCRVRRTSNTAIDVTLSGRRMGFEFTGTDAVYVEHDWVSPQYGVRKRAPVIRAVADVGLPTCLGYRMSPA